MEGVGRLRRKCKSSGGINNFEMFSCTKRLELLFQNSGTMRVKKSWLESSSRRSLVLSCLQPSPNLTLVWFSPFWGRKQEARSISAEQEKRVLEQEAGKDPPEFPLSEYGWHSQDQRQLAHIVNPSSSKHLTWFTKRILLVSIRKSPSHPSIILQH